MIPPNFLWLGENMLHKRNNVFYFRRSVPKLLVGILNKREIWISLHTDKLSHAKPLEQRLNQAIAFIDVQFKLRLINCEEALRQLQSAGFSAATKAPIDEIPNISRQDSRIFSKQEQSQSFQDLDLKTLYEMFAKEKSSSGSWSAKTTKEYKAAFSLFWRFLNESGQPAITHKLLLGYRNTLMALPPRHESQQQLRGKTLADIAAMKHDMPLSNRQINKQTICISSFWKWLVLHDYVKENPAHSLLLPKCGIGKSPDTERGAYTADEMKKILVTLDQQREQLLRTRPERYWIPILSAYSGLRLGECSQLLCDDVLMCSDIWCLDIKATANDDKRLKTLTSTRRIPLHPAVTGRGFLNYLEEIKSAGHTRLFPLLVCHPVNGYGHHVGKAYATWNRKFITNDKMKTFHSMRHAVANELKQSGVAVELISELLGHRVESISMGRYGKKFRPEALLEAIKKLPW